MLRPTIEDCAAYCASQSSATPTKSYRPKQLGAPDAATATAQSLSQGGFALELNSVAPADLEAAATQEGAAGRVVTALSVDGTAVTYLAYAWSSDTATVYEAQVATATTAQAPAAAANLAAQGYLITAIGPADDDGGLYLVGTRVQGDSLPRPFLAAAGGSEIEQLSSCRKAGASNSISAGRTSANAPRSI